MLALANKKPNKKPSKKPIYKMPGPPQGYRWRESMASARMAFFDGVTIPGSGVDPDFLPPPPAWLAITEAQRVALEVLSLSVMKGLLADLPRGDGHPVMVLPGFLGSDTYNGSLRRFLSSLGYAVHGWGLGRNLGPREGTLERLLARFHFLYEQHGEALSLVGHSLGGIFARELAREVPSRVRQVISLGSPFGRGRMSGSYPARLFAALNPIEELPVEPEALHLAPPVPTTAIYSKGDGIVNWKTAVQQPAYAREPMQNIQVRGSHCGMTLNPTVWYILADRLGQAADRWEPFNPSGIFAALIPKRH
jgi:pimeloyl-ACP methyl ester carboxylesterase